MPKSPGRLRRLLEALVCAAVGYLLSRFLLTNHSLTPAAFRASSDCPLSARSTQSAAGWSDTSVSTASQGKLWRPVPFRTFAGPRRAARNSIVRPTHARNSFNACRRWAVITTIFKPSPLLHQLRGLHGWCVVVVGDLNTADRKWGAFARAGNNTVYLSAKDQEQLGYAVLPYLPWGHFGRKNVGYLYAMRHGATQIWDTDDDNKLRVPRDVTRLSDFVRKPGAEIDIAYSEHHLWNPYSHFRPLEMQTAQSVQLCWPRGFPLEYVKDDAVAAANFSASVRGKDVAVLQSLASRDPDVDAIYRLTKQMPITFMNRESRAALPLGRVAPFNAQATLWDVKAFWGMLLPVSVHGRVSDIWRSYFTQRIMQELGLHVAFVGPIVEQRRNEHALMADLQAEVPLYTQAHELTKWLRDWKPRGAGLAEWVEELVIDLYEIGVLEESDVQLQQAWLDDLEAMKYEMRKPKKGDQSAPEVRVVADEAPKEPAVADVKANVAVCVSGQVRTLDMGLDDPNHPNEWFGMKSDLPNPNMTVAESIQRNLYPKLGNVDVFMVVATNETEREPKVGDMSVCESLRPENGHLTCEVPKEEPIHVHNMDMWNKFELYRFRRKQNRGETVINGLLQQLKGMYDCHRAITQHSMKTGKQYDWMVRLRTDDYIHSFPDLETLSLAATEPTIWYGSFRVCCCGNEDRFGIARTDWMRRYFDRFLYLQQEKWDIPSTFNAEKFLEVYLDIFGVKLRAHRDIEICTVKPLYRTDRSQP